MEIKSSVQYSLNLLYYYTSLRGLNDMRVNIIPKKVYLDYKAL